MYLNIQARTRTNKHIMSISKITTIVGIPNNPLEMFKMLLRRSNTDMVVMNLATVDRESGVLNRTVVYRGLTNDEQHIVFVTERNSRKYQNLKECPKLSVTFLFPEVKSLESNCPPELWQVRLFKSTAEELSEEEISNFWAKETLFAKIRSHLCECGRPIDHEQLKLRHDEIVQQYENGQHKLEQTSTYTAFKILPNCWDFYKAEVDSIADRVQYFRKTDNENQWEHQHVSA